MKKLMLLIAMFMIMAGATSAFADSHGSTLVPMMRYQYKSTTNHINLNLFLSNITDKDIECTVKFYDHDGNAVDYSEVTVYKGNNEKYAYTKLSTGNTFTIPANASRQITFAGKKQKLVLGHGMVEWKTDNEKISKALTGVVQYNQRTGSSTYGQGYLYLNNGQPF